MQIIAYSREILEKNRQFFWYSIIGFSGVTLDFLVFYFLNHELGIHHQVANLASVSIGITNNFILNAFFNFRMTDRLFTRYLKFLTVGLLGLLLSSILLYVQIDVFSIRPLIAKIVTIGFVVVIQFTLNKKFSFKQTV